MNYTILIKYSSDPEKAGKITIVDENHKLLLKNASVAVPDDWRHREQFEQNYQIKAKLIEYSDKLALSDETGQYKAKFKEINQNHYMEVLHTENNKSDVIFVGSKDEKIKKDKAAIVLNVTDFLILTTDLHGSNNNFQIKAERTKFFWSTPKLTEGYSNIQKNLYDFNLIESKLLLKEKNLLEQKQKSISLDKPEATKVDGGKSTKIPSIQTPNPKKLEFNDPPSITNSKSGVGANNQTTTAKSGIPKKVDFKESVQPSKTSSQSRTSSSYQSRSQPSKPNDDSLDMLDALLIYNYPGMAPFIKPNSALAWIVYFNYEANQAAQLQSVQQIPGCENVKAIDVTKSGDGSYQVNLYKDDQKQDHLGCVDYNSSAKQYNFTDTNDHSNSVNYVGDNIQCSLTSPLKDAPSTFNFTPTDQGYTGDFNVISSGNAFSSSFELTPSFDYKTPTILDPSPSMAPSLSNDNRNDYTFSSPLPAPSPDLSNDYKPKDDWTPPPPPPPPPDFNSSDSYNTGSSFKM